MQTNLQKTNLQIATVSPFQLSWHSIEGRSLSLSFCIKIMGMVDAVLSCRHVARDYWTFLFLGEKNLKFDLCLKTNLMGVVDGLFLCCRYVANVKHHWPFLMLMNRAQSMNECSQLVSPISGTFNILHLGHCQTHILESSLGWTNTFQTGSARM